MRPESKKLNEHLKRVTPRIGVLKDLNDDPIEGIFTSMNYRKFKHAKKINYILLKKYLKHVRTRVELSILLNGGGTPRNSILG